MQGDAFPAARRAALVFGSFFWFTGVCPDIVDPSIHQGKQLLGASKGQLAERDVGPLVSEVGLGIKTRDTQMLEVSDQPRARPCGRTEACGTSASPGSPAWKILLPGFRTATAYCGNATESGQSQRTSSSTDSSPQRRQ